MNIEKLPRLQNLAHVDCQYFYNPGGRGTTKHRLKFQYKTVHGHEDQFFVNLTSSKSKNLISKCTRIAGARKAQELKLQAEELRKEFDAVSVGFRVVQTTHHYDGTEREHAHYQADQFTVCWFLGDAQGNFFVHLQWNGETLVMPAMIPTSNVTPGQSQLISYYHAQHELKQRIRTKFGKEALGNAQEEPADQGPDVCGSEQPSCFDRVGETSDLGELAEASMDDLPGTQRPRISVESSQAEDTRKLVDSDFWGVWRSPGVQTQDARSGPAFRI